jgi:hypothetical protein
MVEAVGCIHEKVEERMRILEESSDEESHHSYDSSLESELTS